MGYLEENARHFYSLFYPLLNYTNEKRRLVPGMKKLTRPKLPDIDHPGAMKLANSVWEDPSILERFVADHPELSEEDRRILLSWKRRFRGKFLVWRTGKTSAVMFGQRGDAPLLVRRLLTPWEGVLTVKAPPCAITTTLLPFQDYIVYDGYIGTLQQEVPAALRKMAQEKYTRARRENSFLTSL